LHPITLGRLIPFMKFLGWNFDRQGDKFIQVFQTDEPFKFERFKDKEKEKTKGKGKKRTSKKKSEEKAPVPPTSSTTETNVG
jgi:hypothetical protein